MDISAHIHTFEQEMKRRNFGTQTIENYSSCLKKFFGQSAKDHPKNIHEQDIKEFLGTFTCPNTQRSYHSAIKKFYEICLGQKDKFKYIPYARKDSKLPIVLSVEEVQRILDACTNLKHRTIICLMYSSAIRVSEVINMKIADIDSSRMIINIIQAKGHKDRQVGLNQPLLELLRKYYLEYKPKEYLFEGQLSPQYSARSIAQFLQKYADLAGLKKRIYPHLLRHTSATHLVENGIDINLIQKLLGHANVKTTGIYTHISHNLISKIPSPLQSIRM